MGDNDKNYSQEIQDRIRELAHSMWEWAGRQQDVALHYWVAAEKEVLATMRAAADKLMPGEKPEKVEESTADAATARAAGVRRGRGRSRNRTGRGVEG